MDNSTDFVLARFSRAIYLNNTVTGGSHVSADFGRHLYFASGLDCCNRGNVFTSARAWRVRLDLQFNDDTGLLSLETFSLAQIVARP